jgi:hypothetical protein
MQTSRVASIGAILLASASAYAQPAPTEPQPEPTEPQPAPAPAPAPAPNKPDEAKLTVAGYVEAYYQAHFQDPSNRITNLRGYDNRSGSFTLSNVASISRERRAR